jgi:TRAP-type uncharacterized transport system fused permease subunit
MKVISDWRKHLRSYSALSLIANLLISMSYGISIMLGMGLVSLSPVYIIIAMTVVAVLGFVGKFIAQFEDDIQEEHNNE